MIGAFRVTAGAEQFLPGRVADYLDTPVHSPKLQALLARDDIRTAIESDTAPLPTPSAREGYFGDRHLEYWLSGYDEMEMATTLTGFSRVRASRLLDFGGASGRTARHALRMFPGSAIHLCDLNPQHVECAQSAFGGALAAFQNTAAPSLPFEAGYFDCITAFSVFTHIHHRDLTWLLELRRCVRPGGTIYLTLHDENTWRMLPETILAPVCLAIPAFREYYEASPVLTERCAIYYNGTDEYSCNAFVPQSYIEAHWAPHFKSWKLFPLGHGHQTALLLEV